MSARRCGRLCALAFAIAVTFCADLASAGPATIVVDSLADTVDADPGDGECRAAQDECTLRAAVMEANVSAADETITLPPGEIELVIEHDPSGDETASGDIRITDSLTIVGAGRDQTTISTELSERLFQVAVGVSVDMSRLTLTGGNPFNDESGIDGGAIRSGFGDPEGATLFLDDIVVVDNFARVGGGVDARGVLEVRNSVFLDNDGYGMGGAIRYTGTPGDHSGHHLSIVDSEIADNRGGSGAGVNTNGATSLENVAIHDNTAEEVAGGLAYYGTATLDRVEVRDNHVTGTNVGTGVGGGIFTNAGLFADSSTLTLTHSIVTGNTAANTGGGFAFREYEDGVNTVSIRDSVVSGNSANEGGAMRVGSFGPGGDITIADTLITANTSVTDGGGIYADGVAGAASVTLENVTLSGNLAGRDGGGVYSTGALATTTIVQSTVTANMADEAHSGNGEGGGISSQTSDTIRVTDSIVFGNIDGSVSGPQDCAGRVTPTGANIIGNPTCILDGSSTGVTGDDPLLQPLADNGGPNMTHALGAGSPAIDAALLCPPPDKDQRGAPRPYGPACDLGAYEAGPLTTPAPTPSPSPTPAPGTSRIWGNVDCDGELSTRDNQAELRFVLQQNPLSQTEPCPDLGASVTADGATRLWGDEDCDGEVTTRDNQSKLRAVLQQNPLSQTEPCPDVGTSVLVQ